MSQKNWQNIRREVNPRRQAELKNSIPGRHSKALLGRFPQGCFLQGCFLQGGFLQGGLSQHKKRQLLMAASSALLLMAVLFSMISLRRGEEALASRIAPEILRFHVLANSDSEEDQTLKMEVKQMLIDAIYEGLRPESGPGDKAGSPPEKQGQQPVPFAKETIRRYVLEHREALEEAAEAYMAKRGKPYSASIRLERFYFPTKIYGDMVFPCGTYDAVRVLLGSGEGKNWWCVLYPPLCFTDNACGQVPDSSKQELRSLLADEDYRTLAKDRTVVFGERREPVHQENAEKKKVTVRVRFRLAELLGGKRQDSLIP